MKVFRYEVRILERQLDIHVRYRQVAPGRDPASVPSSSRRKRCCAQRELPKRERRRQRVLGRPRCQRRPREYS
jgi:hypothetical protein